MSCNAYNLGKPCHRPNHAGTPYCQAHFVVVQAPVQGPAIPLPPPNLAAPGSEEPLDEFTSDTHDASDVDASPFAIPPDSDPQAFDSVAVAENNTVAWRCCRATTRRGTACGFPPRRGQDYCINHAPGADRAGLARRAGSAPRRNRLVDVMEVLTAAMSFTDRTSIQATLDGAVRLYLSGRLGKEQYRELLRGCALAIRNFDKAGDTLAGPRPQAHEWDDYFDKVKSLLLTADPLLDVAEDPETDEFEGA